MTDFIHYPKIIDCAMHQVIKEVLTTVNQRGSVGNHSFYISFLTSFPKVEISKKLQACYPEEMTIVLQHQFSNLTVENDKFSVCLSFSSVIERIVVPFQAITNFTDPDEKLVISFNHFIEEYKSKTETRTANLSLLDDTVEANSLSHSELANVIRIDQFRQKPKKN